MDGRHGYMPISTFEEIVSRNATYPNIRFITTRWGPRFGAPKETTTLVIGNADKGNALNIPVPDLPEHTQIDPKTDRIVHRGWRALLQILIADRTLRPSRELEKVLGYRDFEHATKGLCF